MQSAALVCTSSATEQAPAQWYLSGCIASAELTDFPVNTFPFVIGRQSGAGLTIPSRSISKRHAELLLAGDAVLVRDLGSTNGTYVNGRRLAGVTPLGDGDLLRFAEAEFRLCSARSAGEYDARHTETIDCRLGIISQIDALIRGQSVFPCYQPIVNLADRSQFAFEALARSDVPDLWYPGEMFAAASRLNLASPLSAACRRSAMTHARRLPGRPTVFVNMHPSEPLFAVVQQLRENRPHLQDVSIVLEVHEAAVTDPVAMRRFKNELAELGVGLAYDDFGAGQSRLLDIVRVPPDYLKFDIEFVRDMEKTTPAHRAMVKALVGIVHDLDIKTLAEGIETAETAEACRDLGFDFAQGYHFGRPRPADCWSPEFLE